MLIALQRQVAETNETAEFRADEVFTIHIGKTPPRKQHEWFSFDRADNVIWMSIKDMGNAGAYLIDSSEYLTRQAVEKYNIQKCQPGSILLSFKLTIGRVGIVANEMVTNEAIACFASDDQRKLAYLYPLLLTYDYASMGSTSSIATAVNSKMVKAMPLKMPGENALDDYFKQAKPILDLLLSSTREIAALEQLRDTLLPKLMSGEINVSEIELPMQPNNHLPVYRYCILQTVPIRIWKGTTMEAIINTVLAQMQPLLNGHQLKQLAITLRAAFEHDKQPPKEDSADLLALFLTAKEVEGCSPKTIAYYRTTLEHMTEAVAKPYTQVTSDDLRSYLSDYELKRGAGKVTVDNIRRIMSSFFSWLEDEDYVVKSPVRRIHRVKCAQVTKEVLTDEQVESLRDGCTCTRDLAIIEMLASTGMRVGELVKLDIADIDLQERECVVIGKGNKQRPVYFDARAKLRINEYLAQRHDDSPALFVSLRGEPKRMTIGNVETRMRELGRATSVGRVHPHKFRRTLATRAIDKGMPIEQVQKLLGHAKIDTTMRYAMVDQNNVKTSHRKYLE